MDTNNYLDFIDLPIRPKPRKEGLTIFSDQFMSNTEVESFLEVAAEAIDYAKLIHIGLEKSLPKGWLKKKLRLYKDNDIKIYPGGVPFQVVVRQNKVPQYFKWLAKQGFDAVEIAEDAMVTKLEPPKRDEYIKMALNEGLEVITELGEKHPEQPMNLDEAYENIMHELSLGVSHVTIERSELDAYINADPAPLVNLVKRVGMNNLLFEPGPFGWPHVHRWVFKVFGPNANLGNIYKEELIYVEWSRRGLSRLVNYTYFK